MTRERVVIDTNVLIGGLLSTTSTPAQAVERAVTHAQLVATTATLRELMTKLLSPKFDATYPANDATRYCSALRRLSRSSTSGKRFADRAIRRTITSSKQP